MQFKDFIDNNIEHINRIPAYLKDEDPNKGPLSIILHLTLTIDNGDIKNYVKLAKKRREKLAIDRLWELLAVFRLMAVESVMKLWLRQKQLLAYNKYIVCTDIKTSD